MNIRKVLIINIFGIGDVLFTTPLVTALKSFDASISVSYLANARTAEFLRKDPCVDEVFVYERDEFVAVYRQSPWKFWMLWKELLHAIRSRDFDLAFDCSLNSAIGIMLFLARIPQRVGFNYKKRSPFMTSSLPLTGFEGKHVAVFYSELLARAGIYADRQTLTMRLYSSPKDNEWALGCLERHGLRQRPFIIIYPGGGASWGRDAGLKRWGVGNYAKLADKIIEKADVGIILMGSESEVPLCQEVASRMVHKPIQAAGTTSITEAAALMKKARLVIANDGGPLHIAVASGVKTASLFGPVDPVVYGPFPAKGHRVALKGLPCQPCYRNFRMTDCKHVSCLRSLTVDEVFATIEELL